jgi:hypothetical protein
MSDYDVVREACPECHGDGIVLDEPDNWDAPDEPTGHLCRVTIPLRAVRS